MTHQPPIHGKLGSGMRLDPRVNFVLRDNEKLVGCPYEKSHFVLENKLTLHLTRCRHNYLKVNPKKRPVTIEICTHNYNHHVPIEELEEHELNCPDVLRERKEKEERRLDLEKLGILKPSSDGEEDEAAAIKRSDFEEEQRLADAAVASAMAEIKQTTKRKDWDWERGAPALNPSTQNERFVGGYDPRKTVNMKKHDLILNPQGLTRGERREFRKQAEDGFKDADIPPIQPRFVGQTRDTRVPVGYPGWELNEGNRRTRFLHRDP